MSNIIDASMQDFKKIITDESIVVVDFWAPWCGPCRMVSPLIDQLAEEHDEYVFGKINVDEEGELAEAFGIMSIPTLVVLRGGEIVRRESGSRPKSQILALLEEA